MARRAREGVLTLTRRAPARVRLRRAARAGVALAGLALAALAAPRASAGGRASWGHADELRLNERRRAAIRSGCDWIAAQKNPDGSFGQSKALVATTALSALALMADGSTLGREGRGRHGDELRRAIVFLVRLVEEPPRGETARKGYFDFPQDPNSRMHGQGYATLALASALGTAASADDDLARRIRDALRLAVLVSEKAQTGTGGWGYDPDAASEHEGSVTVTVAQGLRAARDAGVKVSDPTVRAGLRYLEKSQKRDDSDEDGSFKYSLTQERSSYALTAAALSSFFLFGEYGSTPDQKDRIQRAVAYLKRRMPDVLHTPSQEGFFYYGNFYAAWAAWQKDGDAPEPLPREDWGSGDGRGLDRTTQLWGPWHSQLYPRLLALQTSEGRWPEQEADKQRMDFGDLVPTAFAVLTLAIPDELIPVFQR